MKRHDAGKNIIKAQSLIEIALLLCFVVVVTLGLLTGYNKLKTKLIDMTKPRLLSQFTHRATISLNINRSEEFKIVYKSLAIGFQSFALLEKEKEFQNEVRV